jgi:hypothetical protein
MQAEQEFVALVTAVVERYLAQNGRSPASPGVAGLASRLFALIEERGLPPPLAEGDCGQPGGMSDETCSPLVARVMAGADDVRLEEAARQLVKACFYPEFAVCRGSYHAADPEGRCRRQEPARVRGRLSGSHCVDCPYWVSLDEPAHRDLLRASWRGDRRDFEAHADLCLPGDFRRLRRWLHAHARRG